MSDVVLIGGEMSEWSDARPGERAAVRGPALAHLLDLLRVLVPAGGRVLVAGPHDESLLDALTGLRVTCLLRSQPDATQLATRPDVQVVCGTLPKLTDAEHYDVVVALDGLGRLCSVEGPQYDWAQSLSALHRALRPGGSLLLAVENELGVHRLVDRATATSARTEGSWNPVGELDPARPGNPTRLAARLAAEHLSVSWLAAAWPVPEAPTLIATPGALGATDAPTGALVAAASGAVAAAYAGRPVLSDPRRLAAAAMRGGLGAELAASWLVLAHRAPRSGQTPALPQVLLADAGHGPVQELTHDRDGRWVRGTVAAPTASALAGSALAGSAQAGSTVSVAVVRWADRLDGPVPAGRLLEELLLTACLRHDLPAARRLLTGYTAWLTGRETRTAFATFDNVLLDGESFALLDPSWDTATPTAAPVAAVRAVRRFAVLLITGGYAHPWPAVTDTDALTTVLAAAAGIELDTDLLAAALQLEVDVLAATGPCTDREALLEQVRHPGEAAPTIGPDSWREREEFQHRLREQLTDATARARWFEAQLIRRDVELRRARLQIAAFSGSPGYRLAKLGMAAARQGIRAARRLQRLPGKVRRRARTKR